MCDWVCVCVCVRDFICTFVLHSHSFPILKWKFVHFPLYFYWFISFAFSRKVTYSARKWLTTFLNETKRSTKKANAIINITRSSLLCYSRVFYLFWCACVKFHFNHQLETFSFNLGLWKIQVVKWCNGKALKITRNLIMNYFSSILCSEVTLKRQAN